MAGHCPQSAPPDHREFMEELPKTISGKIKRAQIRQRDSGQEEPDIYGEDI